MFKNLPKPALFVIGVIAVVSVGWMLWLGPTQARWIALQSKADVLSQKLSIIKKQSPAIIEWQKKLALEEQALDETKQKMGALERSSLSEETWRAVLEGEPVKGHSRTFAVQNLTQVSRQESWPYVRARVKIAVVGSFQDIVEYYELIEKASPLVHVLSSKISRRDTDGRIRESLELDIDATYRLGKAKDERLPKSAAPEDLGGTPFIYAKPLSGSIVMDGETLKLSAVFFRGKNAYAVINGEPKKAGEAVLGDITLKSITDSGVILSQKGIDSLISA